MMPEPTTSPSKQIALVGMMGSGKSTVGALLAERLGRRFYDSDADIEAQTSMTVAEIFAEQGEQAFRDLEEAVVASALLAQGPGVIAVAGGAVMREATRWLLSENSTVIWLRAPVDVLTSRVVEQHLERPMLGSHPGEALQRLSLTRDPVYEALADYTVSTDGREPAAIVDEIIEALR